MVSTQEAPARDQKLGFTCKSGREQGRLEGNCGEVLAPTFQDACTRAHPVAHYHLHEFIYGILYLFFEAYPIAFQELRGYSLGIGALPFISIGLDIIVRASIVIYITLTRFQHMFKENGSLMPEDHLMPMIIGGAFLPIGLFWFAWTSNPHISPWPQIIAGIPVGAGIQMISLQGLVYIIDVYLMHANSAIAANTFVRSWVGAGFPMFAMAFYGNLGVSFAMITLANVSLVLLPVPILFIFYG